MPTKITIRPLFVYSPEYLDTYCSVQSCRRDNAQTYKYTMEILSNNISSYMFNIDTVRIRNYCYKDLQKINDKLYNELTVEQMQMVVNNYSKGFIPRVISQLKYDYTLLILQVKMKENNHHKLIIRAPKLNKPISTLNEAVLIMGRVQSVLFYESSSSVMVNYNKNFLLFPTLIAHGLGHLLGCHHTVYDEGKVINSAHAHTVFNSQGKKIYGTIMSTDTDNIAPYYSNPFRKDYPEPFRTITSGNIFSNACAQVNNNLERLGGMFIDEEKPIDYSRR